MKIKMTPRALHDLEDDKLGIKMTVGICKPEHVATMQALASGLNPGVQVALYALGRFVISLSISGNEINPEAIAAEADLRDPETVVALRAIAAMVYDDCLLSDEVKKKLKRQRKPSGQENSA